MSSRKPFVLFVCRHNTGRSQMAEAFLRRLVGDTVEVASAGTTPDERVDPIVVQAMAEVGIDLAGVRPKLLKQDIADRADQVITMGCDVDGVRRIDDDWGLPDPKGQPLSEVRKIRNTIEVKARALADSLTHFQRSPGAVT